MLGETEFGLMKRGVLFCNMARAGVVQRAALETALKADKLGGVALDVHWEEPGWNPTDALYTDHRVIALPHVGSTTSEVFERFADWIVDNIRRFRTGKPLVGQQH